MSGDFQARLVQRDSILEEATLDADTRNFVQAGGEPEVHCRKAR